MLHCADVKYAYMVRHYADLKYICKVGNAQSLYRISLVPEVVLSISLVLCIQVNFLSGLVVDCTIGLGEMGRDLVFVMYRQWQTLVFY